MSLVFRQTLGMISTMTEPSDRHRDRERLLLQHSTRRQLGKICLYKPYQHLSVPLVYLSPLNPLSHCPGYSATWVWVGCLCRLLLHNESSKEGNPDEVNSSPLIASKLKVTLGTNLEQADSKKT